MRINEIDEPSSQIAKIAEDYGNKIVTGSYKYQLSLRRRDLGEDLKPDAQLWTSTASQRGRGIWTSDWHRFCLQDDDFANEWNMETGILFRVRPGVKILPIGSDATARKIAEILGRKFSRSGYAILSNFPWDELSYIVDGIRYSPRGAEHTRGYHRNPLMAGWSVESTAWYDTYNLENLGEVKLSQARF